MKLSLICINKKKPNMIGTWASGIWNADHNTRRESININKFESILSRIITYMNFL